MKNDKPLDPAVVTQEPFNSIDTLPKNGTQSMTNYNYTWPIPLYSENYRNKSTNEGSVSVDWLVPGSNFILL